MRPGLFPSNLLYVLCGWLLALCADVALAVSDGGTPVAAMLDALRAEGLDVNYSSDLVPPDLRASPGLPGADPVSRARQALAPHGLMLRQVGPRRFVVTRTDGNGVAPPTPPDERLDEVSVYGSRYSVDGRSLGVPQLMTPNDIELIPGSHDDTLRALQALPGIATNASGRPYIRGSLTDDVLIRFDGVPLVDPYHLKNFQSLISAIDPAAVERIELFSGGFPVRYGTRSGGVIDIVPPTGVVGIENAIGVSVLTAGASSVGRLERWPVEWLVAARRSTLDLLEPVENGFGTPQFSDTVGRIRWVPGSDRAWSMGWLVLDDRIALGDLADEEFSTARYRDEYLWLTRERTHDARWSSRTTAVATSARRERDGVLENPGVSVGRLSERRGYESFEVLSDWIHEPNSYTTSHFGGAFAMSEGRYNYSRRVQFGEPIAAAFGRAPADDLDFSMSPKSTSVGLYASHRRQWRDWEAELGLRVDSQRYQPGSTATQWSPRVNVRYDVSARARLYASLGRFTQAQRVDEWRSEEGQTRPDPAQRALHSIVGYELLWNDVTRFSIEAYSKRWTTVSPYFDSRLDPLSLLPDLSPDRQRVAPIRSEAAGLELNMRTEFARNMTAWGTISWSRVADDFGSVDVLRSWDQPIAVTAGLAWKGSRLTLSGLARWHTGWPRTSVRESITADGQSSSLTVGGRNAARWGSFQSLDVRASWAWPLERGDLMTFMELTNAANRRNDCCLTVETAESGGPLEFEIDQWLPLIVNLGVTFRWRSDR